jgi:hypothetical protein
VLNFWHAAPIAADPATKGENDNSNKKVKSGSMVAKVIVFVLSFFRTSTFPFL